MASDFNQSKPKSAAFCFHIVICMAKFANGKMHKVELAFSLLFSFLFFMRIFVAQTDLLLNAIGDVTKMLEKFKKLGVLSLFSANLQFILPNSPVCFAVAFSISLAFDSVCFFGKLSKFEACDFLGLSKASINNSQKSQPQLKCTWPNLAKANAFCLNCIENCNFSFVLCNFFLAGLHNGQTESSNATDSLHAFVCNSQIANGMQAISAMQSVVAFEKCQTMLSIQNSICKMSSHKNFT